MAQTIKLKRSATTGNAPTASQLALGELGINTTDGKLFLKKSVSGTESIVEVGGLPLSGGTLTGNLSLGTNVKAQFGNQSGGDLQIYSDGTNGVLKNTNGNYILLDSDNLAIRSQAGSNRVIVNSSGINVTGSVVADGLTVDGNPVINGTSPQLFFQTGSSHANWQIAAQENVSNAFEISSGANDASAPNDTYTKRLVVQNNGDISFYNDSANQGLFWDSSTSRLGLGTTNPAYPLDVASSNATSIAYQRTGVSAKKWVFNSDNSNTYWANETDNILAMTLSNAGNATFSGSVTADGLTVDGNARIEELGAIAKLTLERGGSQNNADSAAVDLLETNAGSEGANFGDAATNGFRLKLDGSANDFLIQSSASGTVKTRLGIDRDTGDISFYNDSAAQGLFWDSSASSLGIGVTNVGTKLDITTEANKAGIRVTAPNTTNQSFGATIAAGTSASDYALNINNAAGNSTLFKVKGDGSSVFSGAVTAGGHIITNTSSRIENQRISMEADGTLDWGSSKQYGTLTWDTNKAIIVGQQSSSLEFRTNNTGVAMTMDTSQNVNIPNGSLMVGATTAPQAKINVYTDAGRDFRVDHGTANRTILSTDRGMIVKSGAGYSLDLDTGSTSGSIRFLDNGVAHSVFDSSGNLGIGTALPTSYDGNADNLVIGGESAVGLTLASSATNGRGSIYFADGTSGDQKYRATINYFHDSDALTISTAAQERMRIDSSGRVGIGTSSPIQKLHVAGNIVLNASGFVGFGGGTNYIEGSSTNLLKFGTNNIERMRIDSSGNVGIGVSSGDYKFRVTQSGVTQFILGYQGNSTNYLDGDTNIFRSGSGTERMRIDSSGNLLVGNTDPTPYDRTSGNAIALGDGLISSAQSGGNAAIFNRMTNDGSIVGFRKDGSTVGSIGIESSGFYLDGEASHAGLKMFAGAIGSRQNGSDVDATIDLGWSGGRFKDLYLSNNATAQKLTLTKDPVGTYSIEVDGTNTGQPNLIVKQSTSERLRIDNQGRVGIGTSSPIRVLDIATTTGGTIIHLTDDATGHTATDGVDIQQEGTLFQILNREAGDIRFGTDNATRMTITSAGNVGIGTSSPDTLVHAYKASNAILKVAEANGYASLQQSGVNSYLNNVASGGSLIFRNGTAPTERMRIDSSGNLLVGTTDSTPYNNNAGSTADNGIVLSEAGWLAAARYQGTVAFLNRTDNDGDIAVFRRDGTTVGSIGSLSGTQIVIDSGGNRSGVRFEDNGLLPRKNSAMADGTVTLGNPSYKFSDLYLSGTANVQYAGATDTGIYFNGSFNAVVPYRPDTGVAVDDYLDLGVYSHRWDDIFATNGTIQTSDRNEKQDIKSLTEAEERVAIAAKSLLKKFRWKNAVEDKGDDARIHFGIIAQDLQDAFEAEGLDAGRYGMFTSNTWTNEDGEEQTRMGVRYSELLAFIISAI